MKNTSSKSRSANANANASVRHLEAALPDKALTKDGIIAMLEARRGQFRNHTEFWKAVQVVTGMKISYSHLVNVLKKRRPPNDVVLVYLGLEKVEGYRGVNGK